MYITICETDHQSRFNAWDRVLRAGALGWPRGMGWRRRLEGGSGWGTTHVHPWLIHVNVWQNPQYCNYPPIKINKFFFLKTVADSGACFTLTHPHPLALLREFLRGTLLCPMAQLLFTSHWPELDPRTTPLQKRMGSADFLQRHCYCQ